VEDGGEPDAQAITTSSPIGRSLDLAFDFAWQRFVGRVEGIDQDEFQWEPVPGCWTVRRTDDGSWIVDGGGGAAPQPDPPPVTTIAWRAAHVGRCLNLFTERLFGRPPGSSGPEPSGDVADLPAFAAACYRSWRAAVDSARDDWWWQSLGPAWEPYADDNHVDVALHVLDEVVHHTAEIALLRDLYPRRGR